MIINTQNLPPLSPHDELQTYCGLDCCLTMEIGERVRQISPESSIYNFSRGLQAPILDMMLRGWRVNMNLRHHVTEEIDSKLSLFTERLNDFALAVWGKGLNPNSPLQLKTFFYERMKLPQQFIYDKGEKRLSTNEESLERLEPYIYARPFVTLIKEIRTLKKQRDFFTSALDSDGRFRSSFNVAGTETGRLSSSKTAFGTGGNAQNIAPQWRYILIADPGMEIVYIDLSQVEARDVGFICGCLFNRWELLNNCESGDLHTANCKLIWPEINWTGDPGKDRKIADREYLPGMSFRDLSKRAGHLTHYKGTPHTASKKLKIAFKVISDFNHRYLAAYDFLPNWWQWVTQEIQTKGQLTTPFGRKRFFFNRLDNDSTIREAVAFMPQSMTGDRTNLWLWRVWKHVKEAQLLNQTHDSIAFQIPLGRRELVAQVVELMEIPLLSKSGRRYVVPGEVKIGLNYGEWSVSNPSGLRKVNLK